MEYQQLIRRRHHCLNKMYESYRKYQYWHHQLQQVETLLSQQQPLLQFNPHMSVSPHTEVNPYLNVSPVTQVNPHVQVNPFTQINPKLFSDIEVSPSTQAHLSLDPDIYLKLK